MPHFRGYGPRYGYGGYQPAAPKRVCVETASSGGGGM